jgi:hypothetical protein
MSTHDPRTEAEKARAALRANDQMGLAPPESDMERRPSTTPQTFGVHGREAENLEGHDGVTAGGKERRDVTNRTRAARAPTTTRPKGATARRIPNSATPIPRCSRIWSASSPDATTMPCPDRRNRSRRDHERLLAHLAPMPSGALSRAGRRSSIRPHPSHPGPPLP